MSRYENRARAHKMTCRCLYSLGMLVWPWVVIDCPFAYPLNRKNILNPSSRGTAAAARLPPLKVRSWRYRVNGCTAALKLYFRNPFDIRNDYRPTTSEHNLFQSSRPSHHSLSGLNTSNDTPKSNHPDMGEQSNSPQFVFFSSTG